MAFFGERDGATAVMLTVMLADIDGTAVPSRAAIAQRFGFSKSRITQVLVEGEALGYLERDPAGPRPTQRLRGDCPPLDIDRTCVLRRTHAARLTEATSALGQIGAINIAPMSSDRCGLAATTSLFLRWNCAFRFTPAPRRVLHSVHRGRMF